MNKSKFNLMPFQDEPFNGDTHLQDLFIRLRDTHNIKHVIELGTCLGSTTLWLSMNFERVSTVEINKEFLAEAQHKFEGKTNIDSYLGDSRAVLPLLLDSECALIFIDSHWGANVPLRDELAIIADNNSNNVIVIHDFQVPDRDFGYDTYPDVIFNWNYISDLINLIYDYPKVSYNRLATGAMRGVIVIEP